MFAFFGFEFHFPASACSHTKLINDWGWILLPWCSYPRGVWYIGVVDTIVFLRLSVIIHGKSHISQVMAQCKTNQIQQNMIRLSN